MESYIKERTNFVRIVWSLLDKSRAQMWAWKLSASVTMRKIENAGEKLKTETWEQVYCLYSYMVERSRDKSIVTCKMLVTLCWWERPTKNYREYQLVTVVNVKLHRNEAIPIHSAHSNPFPAIFHRRSVFGDAYQQVSYSFRVVGFFICLFISIVITWTQNSNTQKINQNFCYITCLRSH